MKIEISETTFKRLQKLANPLVDTPDSIISRLIEAYDPPLQQQRPRLRSQAPLTQTERDLWETIIRHLPQTFFLQDVYDRKQAFLERRPHLQEVEAAIRATLQSLRNKGFIEFIDNQGQYRRLRNPEE